MKKHERIYNSLLVVLSIALVGLTLTFLAPCEHGMACRKSTLVVQILAVLALGLSVIDSFIKNEKQFNWIYLANGVIAVINILIPSVLVGGCQMDTMACQVKTFPAIYSISSLELVISAVFFASDFSRRWKQFVE